MNITGGRLAAAFAITVSGGAVVFGVDKVFANNAMSICTAASYSAGVGVSYLIFGRR